MKKLGINLLTGFLLLNGCQSVKPEVKATVLSFDASKVMCGGSWQIQVQGEPTIRRVYGYEAVPNEFRSPNTAVWLHVEPDAEQAAPVFTPCNFIKIVSIRKR